MALRRWGFLLPLPALVFVAPARTQEKPPEVLLAFSSYRHHVGYPRIYFYRHNGVDRGTLQEGPPPAMDRSDFDPFLTPDGKLMAYNWQQAGENARLAMWDVAAKKAIPVPASPSAAVDMAPCLTGDGSRLLFSTLFRPGAAGWNLFCLERESGKTVELPNLNSDEDDRMPSVSADGNLIAFASVRSGGAGLQDVWVYDVRKQAVLSLPGLNSSSRESEPNISADGRWLTFVSTRPTGPGKRVGSKDLDVYLYDLAEKRLVELQDLNTTAPDQSPTLSPDGRYLAFVSERFGNAGARDVYLYDRQTRRLLPTPELNSARDDMDPSLAYPKPS